MYDLLRFADISRDRFRQLGLFPAFGQARKETWARPGRQTHAPADRLNALTGGRYAPNRAIRVTRPALARPCAARARRSTARTSGRALLAGGLPGPPAGRPAPGGRLRRAGPAPGPRRPACAPTARAGRPPGGRPRWLRAPWPPRTRRARCP